MSRRFSIPAGTIMLILLMARPVHGGEILDRIVATVNRHAILQSDWDDAVRYEAFIAGHGLNQSSDADKKAALDRLIDQELLREQMRDSDFQPLPDAEVNQRLHEVRKLYASASSDEGWRALLAQWQLTEKELKNHIVMQMNLLRLVDAHLRPSINIDAKSVESYYNQELLPQLRHTGDKQVTLPEVTPQIKELLTQQKMNLMLATWLQSLRAESQIRMAAADSGSQAR